MQRSHCKYFPFFKSNFCILCYVVNYFYTAEFNFFSFFSSIMLKKECNTTFILKNHAPQWRLTIEDSKTYLMFPVMYLFTNSAISQPNRKIILFGLFHCNIPIYSGWKTHNQYISYQVWLWMIWLHTQMWNETVLK